MFGKRWTLFKLFGFEIRVDASWIVLAVLVTWSLAVFLFPQQDRTLKLPPLADSVYWIMGAAAALGLFASVIFHELAHSLVARRFGMQMKGITLFIFGGVSEMGDEPASPKAELYMGLAGPFSSVALGFLFYGVALAGYRWMGRSPTLVVAEYLGYINLLLAIVNMIPAFPLDGGRALRALLWHYQGDMRWATRVAAGLGATFGTFLVVMGLVTLVLVQGGLVNAVWMVLIGLFIRHAARSGYRQLLLRQGLRGEHVRRFMTADVVTVPAAATLFSLVQDYIYKYHYKMFPVVEGDRLVGCISTREVKSVPADHWTSRTVGESLAQCDLENTIGPEADATEALTQMAQGNQSRLLVVEEGRLLGIITLKDIMKFLALKLDLENQNQPRGRRPEF